MAVFKDENGVWTPCGYPNGRVNPQIPPGRFAPGDCISQYPQIVRVRVSRFGRLDDPRKMRAEAVSLNGSIRKGGGCERKD